MDSVTPADTYIEGLCVYDFRFIPGLWTVVDFTDRIVHRFGSSSSLQARRAGPLARRYAEKSSPLQDKPIGKSSFSDKRRQLYTECIWAFRVTLAKFIHGTFVDESFVDDQFHQREKCDGAMANGCRSRIEVAQKFEETS